MPVPILTSKSWKDSSKKVCYHALFHGLVCIACEEALCYLGGWGGGRGGLSAIASHTEFFKDRDAPGLSSSVRINLRRSLTGGLSTIVLPTVLKRSLEPMRS